MRVLFMLLALMVPSMLRSEVPRVATDIAPVHALVSQVMRGIGVPDLVIPHNASPHSYAMRPSEARSLSAANLVIWVGPALTPWLAEPLEALAGGARKLSLMESEGMTLLSFREGGAFEAHQHLGHEHQGQDHDKHGHEGDGHDKHDHDEHGHDKHDHDEHDHENQHVVALDPHLWLDPQNGVVALDAIAAALSAVDPENAQRYHSNAQQGRDRLQAVERDIRQRLAAVQDHDFIVFHDAFHYFENRFDKRAAGAISAGDAAAPGAARIAELRAHLAKVAPDCAFAEPQMNTGFMRTVLAGQATKLGTLDPMGTALPLGPDLYPDLLLALADAMADCLMP
ncbi:zinc ABC transporter substrate-binding protein [Sulfitobacter sp. F26204]|uniref:zinc ABC transporter substrate-binding protein n=1 Tax=Sulfitobacter sp. F26204 TaxID=2996014 RepID=UPI00225DD5FB|nr:zinc ABC transporter substrate-binding protein [Sulfitobacter sp. F26204]MCX7560124.1 zinc ABC transporter substrate-binding protein [Sulfitobacter sp. F26204]